MPILKPPLILIVGPTAVGKTEIAIHLARRIGGEIISADSRLFYRGMDIGTAKPTHEEMAGVPHHLVDIADPDEILSLPLFQQKAQIEIAKIRARGKLPILVGGTGQYIRAVTQGWAPPAVKPNTEMREVLEKIAFSHAFVSGGNITANIEVSEGIEGKKWLHERLKSIDPDAAENIDPRNLRRTIRALEVILTTGRKFSEQRGQRNAVYDLITIGLIRPRAELYARIDERIDMMFKVGLLDEVRALISNGYSPELPTMSAIGYRESINVIGGEWNIEEAKVAMRRATRAFVRRQANWFKETDPNIKWFEVQTGVEDEIGFYISTRLKGSSGN
jgi:tRNA dimethylallyltransferase